MKSILVRTAALLSGVVFPIGAASAGAGGPAVIHVPEPTSVGLFVVGAAAVVYLRARLRK